MTSGGEAWASDYLGIGFLFQVDLDPARSCFERLLRIAREIGDRRQEGWALHLLSAVQIDLADYASARETEEQALRILRETSNTRLEGIALSGLSMIFHHLGDDQAAREYAQQSLLTGHRAADPDVQAWSLLCLGHPLLRLGLLDEAAAAY